jgi:hypothetical protein
LTLLAFFGHSIRRERRSILPRLSYNRCLYRCHPRSKKPGAPAENAGKSVKALIARGHTRFSFEPVAAEPTDRLLGYNPHLTGLGISIDNGSGAQTCIVNGVYPIRTSAM